MCLKAKLLQKQVPKTSVESDLGQWLITSFLIFVKKEYPYAAIYSYYNDDEEELTFLKVWNGEEILFKWWYMNEHDIPYVPYEEVIGKLPMPTLIVIADGLLCKNVDFQLFYG